MKNATKKSTMAALSAAETKLEALKASAAAQPGQLGMRRAIRRAEKQVGHLAHACVLQEMKAKEEKIFRPKKGENKPGKAHKATHTPPAAKPVTTKTGNPNWDAEKKTKAEAAKNAAKWAWVVQPKPVNKGMQNEYEKYIVECALEAAEQGCVAAFSLLAHEFKTPADVTIDVVRKEKIQIDKLNKELAELDYKFERHEARLNYCADRLKAAQIRARVASGLATKMKKKYIALPDKDEKKLAMYPMLLERSRNARVAKTQLELRKADFEKAKRSEEEFIDEYIKSYEILQKKIREAEMVTIDYNLPRKHYQKQKELEEVFAMRYDRADWVPKAEASESYRIYDVPVSEMYSVEQVRLMNEMSELVNQKDKPAGWLVTGRQLATKLIESLKDFTPFKVDSRKCVVNRRTTSMMSDIMGVVYGEKEPCKEMIHVNYDVTNISVYWKFLADKYEDAQGALHFMRYLIAKRLLHFGVEMKIGDKTLAYKMLASTPSEQKKGQATMGEASVMEKTEKLREFGWSMEDAIVRRPDNAVEWLKRNATLMTPSRVVKDKDGKTINIMQILMTNDVEVDREFPNVQTIDGKYIEYTNANGEKKKKLPPAGEKVLTMTIGDGQGNILDDKIAAHQGRGTGLKYKGAPKPNYPLPEFAVDIMGNVVRVADYRIHMSKSCWKAAKMGMNWYEYRDTVMELSKVCPNYCLLRAVRYDDKEMDDDENPRYLARQAIQQWVKVTEEEVGKLTSKTVKWLRKQKKFATIAAKLGEFDKPVEERSPLARLFNKHPELIMHPNIQEWVKAMWIRKRDKACSGALKTEGTYPYIIMDPVAMIQIYLERKDPTREDLGVIPAGHVNLPKVPTGRKVYGLRYPANFLVGMILIQINCKEFDGIGNVAVLSYYGDTIIRADGDFDGDEMLFIFDRLVIELMEKTIKMFNPPLIDFPHGKVPCDTPFGTMKKFEDEVAEALVRAQEYNLVGLYSNLAVIMLQQASIATDINVCKQFLNYAKIAHVGAIVCLDMVKGADVPQELQDMLTRLNSMMRKKYKMPWNQLFSHKELTEDGVEERSNSTEDMVAGTIFDEAGEFEIEFDDEIVEWDDSVLTKLNVQRKIPTFRRMAISDDVMRVFNGCDMSDVPDTQARNELNQGKIGLANWTIICWHLASALTWKMKGESRADKRRELRWMIREVCMSSIKDKWFHNDGTEANLTLGQKYESFIVTLIRRVFGKKATQDGNLVDYNYVDNSNDSYMMFLLEVFAPDICAFFENDGIITEELAKAMTTPTAQEDSEYNNPAYLNEDEQHELLTECGIFDDVLLGGEYDEPYDEIPDDEIQYDWTPEDYVHYDDTYGVA